MATYHIVPSGPGHWRVKQENGPVVSSGHYKKSAAQRAAMKEADSGDSVIVHGANGSIQESRTVR